MTVFLLWLDSLFLGGFIHRATMRRMDKKLAAQRAAMDDAELAIAKVDWQIAKTKREAGIQDKKIASLQRELESLK